MSTNPSDISGDGAALGNDNTPLTEVEELAVEMGWKPEADYTGPPEKWKPAKDYLRTEREINRGLKDTVRSLKDTVDRMASTATKQTERALKQQAELINARFEQAVENKDTRGAAAAVKELRELEAEASPSVTPAQTEEQFAKANPWYGTNRKATAYAVMVAQELGAKKVPLNEQLGLIEAEVRKEFPEIFESGSGTGKTPPAVNTPGRSVQRPKGKTYADLPAEVKAAAEKFAKLAKDKHNVDPEKTKAQYAADYFELQA